MSYDPPPEVLDYLGTAVDDIIASSQFLLSTYDGAPYYRTTVTSVSNNRVLADRYSKMPLRVVVLSRPERKLKVKTYLLKRFEGRIVLVVTHPDFRVNRNVVTLLDEPKRVAAVLGLRLRNLLTARSSKHKHFRAPRVKSSPRPADEHVQVSIPYIYWDGENWGSQAPTSVSTYRRIWSGTRTANYAQLKKEGKLPVNNHSVLIMVKKDHGDFHNQEWLNSPEPYGIGHFGSYSHGLGGFSYGPAFGISHSASQRNRAIQRLREAAIGETANLSETVATLNQTLGMIGNAFHRIGSAAISLSKGNLPKAIGILFKSEDPRFHKKQRPSDTKDLASNWLALQYGWKPILKDIEYLIDSLSNLDLESKPVATVKSSAVSHNVQAAELRPNAVGQPPVVGGYAMHSRTQTRFILRFQVQDQLRAFMSQSGFTNPVSLAWELLPFSFVYDWAHPIGNYLEALDHWGGLVFLDGVETTFTRMDAAYVRSYSGTDLPSGPQPVPTRYDVIKGAFEQHGILLDRVKLNGFPAQSFPSFKNPFSVQHSLNGLALIRSIFGR